MSRHTTRKGFDNPVRLTLLEDDLDEVEESVGALGERIQKLTWAIVGAALSITTASVMLAINIAISGT